MYVKSNAYTLSNSCIFVFLEFSSNCLAGDEPPPGDSSFYTCFWVLDEELPGSTSLTARRHMSANSVFGFLMKGLAVMIKPPGDTSSVPRFLYFRLVLGRSQSGNE